MKSETRLRKALGYLESIEHSLNGEPKSFMRDTNLLRIRNAKTLINNAIDGIVIHKKSVQYHDSIRKIHSLCERVLEK